MTHIIENKGEFALEGVDESYEKIRIVLISEKHQRNQRCGSWERCDPFQGALVLSHAPKGHIGAAGQTRGAEPDKRHAGKVRARSELIPLALLASGVR